MPPLSTPQIFPHCTSVWYASWFAQFIYITILCALEFENFFRLSLILLCALEFEFSFLITHYDIDQDVM